MSNKVITLGSIESFTGGLFASTIISIPNASTFFKGSVVTYNSEIKSKIGVNVNHGVIRPDIALAMADKGRQWLGVDVCVSFTGNAGPGVMENQPVGKCYIAVNQVLYTCHFNGDRNSIRKQAVEFAIKKIKKQFPLLNAK